MGDWAGYVEWFDKLSPADQRREWEKLTLDQRAQLEAARAAAGASRPPAAAPPPPPPAPASPPPRQRSLGRKLLLGCAGLAALGFLVIVGLAILGSQVERPERADETETADPATGEAAEAPDAPAAASPEEAAAAEEERRRRELAGKWSYEETTDEMTSRASRVAAIRSENTVDFAFPYGGRQHATLMLRTHPTWGEDVILSIERGQLLCQEIDRCTLRVRFDDGEPQAWTARPPADHSTTHLFLDSHDRFVERLRRAQVVRLQPEVYQEGSPVFEFQVGGYDHARYAG